jgi:REP element-mobilizing transposase RayT
MKSEKQLAFDLPRPKRRKGGPGRKATRSGTWIKHVARPWHDASQPVHVTMRVRRGVPNLRGYKLAATIGHGLRVAATANWARQKARRRTFRVIHYSVQPNHLHLIVEATSKTALARGMQGLASGLARRVNHKVHRRGSLFADRYHGRALATPTEVRNAIVYVLKNSEKHAVGVPERGTAPVRGLDPCSSAVWFDGWLEPPPPVELAPPVVAPHTWLLRTGWKRHRGPIRRHERPID